MVKAHSTWTLLCGAAALALMAGTARADYPGALWSVDAVEVTGAEGDQAGQIRAALRTASQTYFFGDRAVKVEVRVTGPDAAVLSVVDRATGAEMARTGTMALSGDLGEAALAWMGSLECAALDCLPGAGGTQLAAAPMAVTPAVEAPAAVASVAGAVPVPAPRPGAAPGLEGLDRVRLARTPDLTNAEPIRIARFNTAGIASLGYSDSDTLVLAEPGATGATAPANPGGSTLVGRFLSSVVSFLGFGSATAVAPAAALPAATQPRTVAQPAVTAPTATERFRPSEQWRLTPRAEPQAGVQIAALDPSAATTPVAPATPAATAAPAPQAVSATGLRLVPSPGLRLPAPRQEAGAAVVTPIRFAAVSPGAARAAATPKNLSVKIDPEVFGRYSAASLGRLFGSYGNRNAKVRLVADDDSGGSVDRILASRGLELDSDRFAKAERVYWSGNSGSRGFWISMPQTAPSKYLLIASKKASVIANVYSRGTSVRVSDAVAEALGMQAGGWSDVQVIALKEISQTAGTRTRSRVQ